MALRDKNGRTVDVNWLSEAAVTLLEEAMAAPERDHTACARYIESLTKTLLPKLRVTDDKDAEKTAVTAAREAAAAELRKKDAGSPAS